jgi:hypothetical protein
VRGNLNDSSFCLGNDDGILGFLLPILASSTLYADQLEPTRCLGDMVPSPGIMAPTILMIAPVSRSIACSGLYDGIYGHLGAVVAASPARR